MITLLYLYAARKTGSMREEVAATLFGAPIFAFADWYFYLRFLDPSRIGEWSYWTETLGRIF